MSAPDRAGLRRARLAALGLDPPLGTSEAPVSALTVARHVGALQAQDYGSGAWSLGVRSGLTLVEVEQAVRDRQIVRTWPMRGTIHWVPAEDARWMCHLLAKPRAAVLETRYAQLGMSNDDVELAGRIFEEHLTEPMSRPDLVALLVEAGIDPTEQRAYHLVGHHCMTGLLCQGPLIGRQPSFVLIDSWIPLSRKPSREEGLETVVERYVRSHGPVTEKDLAGWVGGTLALAREGVERLGERIVREQADGIVWLTHAEATGAALAADASVTAGLPERDGVLLLPQWDEFLLGYKRREDVLPPEHLARVVPGRNMVFRPTVVVDGEVAGTWRRQGTGRRVRVEVELFTPPTRRVLRGLEASSAAYGRFLSSETELLVVGE